MKACTVENRVIQLTTTIVWWSGLGSFTQGVDPFYKDNFLLQTKGLDCRQPLKQGLWIFFGILNIPHTHLFLDDLSELLLFIKKVQCFFFLSSSSMWFCCAVYPSEWIQNNQVPSELRKRDTFQLFEMLSSLTWQVSNTFPRLEGLTVFWLFRKPEVWLYEL